MPRPLRVEPVTPERWDDFARLFEARGGPHFCWCTAYRLRDARAMTKTQKRAAMARAVEAGIPVGVLAYDGDEPVGWCSVAPRETYERLERSRAMPRMDNASVWTVLCFFVPRARRGQGIALALLEGAARRARAAGAAIVEGWPHDASGVTATHRGTTALFRAAGFAPDARDARRWVLA